MNIGLDMGFLDNRINLEAAWYKRDNYDLIGAITTQGVGGSVERMANVASMKSHGFEFTLSTRNIESRNFQWSDRKSTRLNSSHRSQSRMPSSA